MARKFGLGSGVNALFTTGAEPKNEAEAEQSQLPAKNEHDVAGDVPEIVAESALPEGVTTGANGQLFVELSRLKPNPQQPRLEFNEEKLKELAASIKEHGVLQAITIENAGDGSFYIIAGERRTRAARLAGLERIPAQIREFDEQKKLEVALIENIQRADLNPVEEAKAYHKLMQISGLSQDQIAVRVGKNRSTVANAVRLLKLPSEMQSALVEGRLTAGHARALLAVKNSNDRRLLFEKIVGGGMNVRRAEEMANELNSGAGRNKQPSSSASSRDPNLAEIEQRFIEAFGTKVKINGTMERGRIEVDYFSREDLDRLFSIITGGNSSPVD